MKSPWKKMTIIIIISLFLILLSLIFGNLQVRIEQERLAKTLEVEIDDYPYPNIFPSGYYYSVLKPGMTIDEVHHLIQGFKKVINCNKVSEIYYFYDLSDEKALRFRIRYDELKNLKEFEGEEKDSRTIQTLGCIEGQLVP